MVPARGLIGFYKQNFNINSGSDGILKPIHCDCYHQYTWTSLVEGVVKVFSFHLNRKSHHNTGINASWDRGVTSLNQVSEVNAGRW